MKATLEVDLQPFQVPNFVRPVAKPGKREDGFTETVAYPLSDLDSMTLWRLCENFKNEVFHKAGKEQPPRAG
jgi:hypothetical protein